MQLLQFYQAHAFCTFTPIQMQTGHQSLDPSHNVPLVVHICTWTVAVILQVGVVVISHYNNAVVISHYNDAVVISRYNNAVVISSYSC